MCAVRPGRTQGNRGLGPDIVSCFRTGDEPLQHFDEACGNGREKLAAEGDDTQLADERRIYYRHRTYPRVQLRWKVARMSGRRVAASVGAQASVRRPRWMSTDSLIWRSPVCSSATALRAHTSSNSPSRVS